MKYPGYLLNPGDMFQVDPERVMFATGAPKDSSDAVSSAKAERAPSEDDSEPAASETEPFEARDDAQKEEDEDEESEDPRKILKSLLAQAKSVIANPKGGRLSAKDKQNLRGFQKTIKRQLSRPDSDTTVSDNLEAQFEQLKIQLLRQPNQPPSAQKDQPSSSSHQQQGEESSTTTPPPKSDPSPAEEEEEEQQSDLENLTQEDMQLLRTALSRLHLNPPDPTKPYATPWCPKPYMSAFAFIPPFLEVNQNICAAVYLRHPVARPGMAEVPTPFGEVTGGNAFAWYLRRR